MATIELERAWELDGSRPSTPLPRHRRRFQLVGLAVSVALVVGACASGSSTATTPAPTAPLDVTGRQQDFSGTFDVGGDRKMFMECSGQGSPTVVFISGGGIAGDVWDSPLGKHPTVYPTIAKTTRVCAYDRPGTTRAVAEGGISRSDPVPQPVIPSASSADLHALLAAAGQNGPFVLAAHSYGGLVARYFAHEYPADVAGMVLIDSFSPELREAMPKDLWPSWIVWNTAPAAVVKDYPDYEQVAYDKALDEVVANRSIPPMPLVVLTADQPYPAPTRPGIPSNINTVTREAQDVSQREVVQLAPGAKHVTATHSGHDIMLQNPVLVSDSIGEVVSAVREGRTSMADGTSPTSATPDRTTATSPAVDVLTGRALTATATGPDHAHFDPAACPTPNLPGVPQLDLGPEYSCGYLTVPVDHAHPDGPVLQIPVARVKAMSPNPKPDPIVYLAGGPGGSGLLSAPAVVANGVNADRDVIFVDQRSTLHANPFLNCPEIDTFNVATIGLAPTAAGTQAAHVAATNACHTRLQSAGYDLAALDTEQNAADIADLRTALGIREWNVYGVSYGTFLALTLLRDYPAGIRSVVVDGVVPPQTNLLHNVWPDVAAGYDTVFDACAAQPACHAAYPNLRQELVDVVNALDRHPLTVTVPTVAPVTALYPLAVSADHTVRVVLDGYQVANLFVLLSSGDAHGLLAMPAIVHALAHGDGTLAATALQEELAGSPSGVTGYPLQWGVFCRENAAFTSPAALLKIARRALPDFPTSTLRLLPQLTQAIDDCNVWNVGKSSPKVHEMTTSSIPVLLLSGTFDLITAPREARVAAQGLSNAHIVDVLGVGHGTVKSSTCSANVMVDFLDNPGPHSNTACVAGLTVPPFDTP